MTTQNHIWNRIANPGLSRAQSPEYGGLNTAIGASPYYYPSIPGGTPTTGLLMDEWDHIGLIGTMICGAGNQFTVTFEGSINGTTWLDISRAGWDTVTGARCAGSYVCGAGLTVNFAVDFDYYNYRYIRVKSTIDLLGDNMSFDCYTKRRKE